MKLTLKKLNLKNLTLKLAFLIPLIAVTGATSLSAASKVDFKGYYRFRSLIHHDYWESGVGEHKERDQFFNHRLRFNVTVSPTDDIDLKWRFQGPNNSRWGSQRKMSLVTDYIYAEVKTRPGVFSLGRVSSGLNSAGLQTLGYAPAWNNWALQGFIFDGDTPMDAIAFQGAWDSGFGLKAFYSVKSSEAPSNYGPGAAGNGSDHNYNRFSIEPYYKWDNGGLSLAVQYDRDHGQSGGVNSLNQPNYYAVNYFVTLNPALMHTWNLDSGHRLGLHLEGKWARGERQMTADSEKYDIDGAGIYGDLTYDYGPGNLTLGAWRLNGSHSGRHDLVTSGEAYYPYVVFYSAYGRPSGASAFGADSSNHWAISLLGNHAFTDYVNLNYGLAHFEKVKTRGGLSKDVGLEADLGLTFQLAEKLTLDTMAGYLIAGGYIKDVRGSRDDTFTWVNTLQFNF